MHAVIISIRIMIALEDTASAVMLSWVAPSAGESSIKVPSRTPIPAGNRLITPAMYERDRAATIFMQAAASRFVVAFASSHQPMLYVMI